MKEEILISVYVKYLTFFIALVIIYNFYNINTDYTHLVRCNIFYLNILNLSIYIYIFIIT
jgi:hypothetical protein